MAVTTAVLSGTITDVIGDLNTALLGRVVLAVEANTDGSLILDTSGDRLMAGAKRVTVDRTTGAYSVTLVKTDSADVIPSGGRLYRAYLQYPSGIPGAGNVQRYSGWFELTADGSLSDADKWPGLEVTAVTQALVDSIGDMQADVETRHGEVMGVVATTEGLMTSVLGSGGTFDDELSATIGTHPDVTDKVAKDELVFNILDHGATTAGTAAANQTAIAAALTAAAVSGGTVYVPPGTFLHNDAFAIPSNVHLRGSGLFSTLKATSLVDGGAGLSHRQIDAISKTGFRISDLMLDASEMTVFTAGMRSILCTASTDYSIERVFFRTPGAAVASIGCSDFTIDRPVATVAATDGIAHHDGVIDQWGGCNNFKIIEPTVYGGGIGKYGILVTGENTDGTPAACYDFTISNPSVFACKSLGIWVNGREGINHSFTIANPLVDGVTDFHGIVISDSYAWTLASPVVKNVGRNGIKVYTETGEGGATGGDDGTISSPVVYNANTLSSASASDGAAIAILDGSNGVTVTGARVKGTLHTYALYFASTVTDCFHGGGSYQTGTLGKVGNNPAGGSYTPTITGVANVAASTPRLCRWVRVGDFITVTGRIEITPTAAASTATTAGVSLPVASNLADSTRDLSGVGNSSFGLVAAFTADTTNDRAQVQFPAPNTSSNTIYFSFTYTAL